jgi:bis(5'-nucleosyl)-tetraphosphatase (symmetrical)
MSTWVIGDLQGCFTPFIELLAAIDFSPSRDQLWIAGDLVNRGEDSLSVLRWCRKHEDSVTCVLGNHDLHLLAVAEGYVEPHRKDTLDVILKARGRDKLLKWLRHQPLVHRDGAWLMVHAGLPPEWSAAEAQGHAAELEEALRSRHWRKFLKDMYGNEPRRWDPALSGQARLRYLANVFTRTRFLHADGGLDYHLKHGLDQPRPEGLTPWFDFPGRRSTDVRILFGHWSALGLLIRPDVIGLDTGCLWGGALTAFCLEDGQHRQVRCKASQIPG